MRFSLLFFVAIFVSCAAMSPHAMPNDNWYYATDQAFSGGVKGSPSGIIYSVELCAPVSYRDFKTGIIGIGEKCYATSVRIKGIGKPLEVFSVGDTIVLTATLFNDGVNKTPTVPCTSRVKKNHAAYLTWFEKGREKVLHISAFKDLPALSHP